jgi:hypothetical protein
MGRIEWAVGALAVLSIVFIGVDSLFDHSIPAELTTIATTAVAYLVGVGRGTIASKEPSA